MNNAEEEVFRVQLYFMRCKDIWCFEPKFLLIIFAVFFGMHLHYEQ